MFTNPPRRSPELVLKTKLVRMDFGGTLILVSMTVSFLLALNWGGVRFAWSNAKVWGCLLVSGILASVFLKLQQWRKDE